MVKNCDLDLENAALSYKRGLVTKSSNITLLFTNQKAKPKN